MCKAGVARLRKIWLTRHGESEYNEMALIGGNSNLTPAGQIYARLLPDAIVDRVPLVRRPCRACSHYLRGRFTTLLSSEPCPTQTYLALGHHGRESSQAAGCRV